MTEEVPGLQILFSQYTGKLEIEHQSHNWKYATKQTSKHKGREFSVCKLEAIDLIVRFDWTETWATIWTDLHCVVGKG